MPQSPSRDDLIIKLPNSDQSIELVFVQGGEFPMGAGKESHPVQLSDFYIGRYPVTQAQWMVVMGEEDNSSRFQGARCPVDTVSWKDCARFLRNCLEQTGHKMQLPTEAQWEYAARGGRLSRGYTYSGSDRLEEVGWFNENSYGESKPVGLKLANELGLYDMSGNVWEWCLDWYGDYPAAEAPTGTDPTGPDSGDRRVLRGGGWFSNAGFCRCAYRLHSVPRYRRGHFGFRVALSAQSTPAERQNNE